MLLKGLLSAAALIIGVTTSAGIILNGPDTPDGNGGALSLAPLSLGNPTAGATLTTLRTDLPNPSSGAADPGAITVPLIIGRGDTLAGLMTKAGVHNAEAQAAIFALRKLFDPRRITKNHNISLTFQPPAAGTPAARNPALGRFTGLLVEPDYNTAFKVGKDANNRFTASKIEKTLNRVLTRTEGTIESSLYLSGRRAGIPDRVLVELIRAYSWDVDFQRDIRTGDGFQVMYEKLYDEHGNQVHSGDIRFAALTLSGKRHAIYRHTTKDGTDDYFDEKGRSARKALMRTPIDGARLSSGFGKRRHPILGYNKMHRGVDFAAARGTPIYAAGNGFVVKSGRNGAYGNYVKIRHNNRYHTAYAHMRRIHKSASQGKRVKQGQIIGYVGTTGRSTGPHLHYEILVGGRRTNPMRVKMPSGRKLKGTQLETFLAARTITDERFAALPPERKVADARN
ncbi:MAG: M23 family metallopeptidase [Rhodospirillales bacterium]|nr:M23 family metallopeptidase [Rhodospirillales bacterium]